MPRLRDELRRGVQRTWRRLVPRRDPHAGSAGLAPAPMSDGSAGTTSRRAEGGPAAGAASLNGYAPDVVAHHEKTGMIAEQYRALRTQIVARGRLRKVQTHLITSAAPEEGKSLTAVNLAIAFAEMRTQRTLLLEADLRRPSLHRWLRRRTERGLLQVLRGEAPIEDVIQPTAYENLQYIAAGGRDLVASTDLLAGPRMAATLDALKARYDHVILDAPSVMAVADACVLGARCDEVFLVLRLRRTPAELADAAKGLLRAAGCEIAGVVLTHVA